MSEWIKDFYRYISGVKEQKLIAAFASKRQYFIILLFYYFYFKLFLPAADHDYLL